MTLRKCWQLHWKAISTTGMVFYIVLFLHTVRLMPPKEKSNTTQTLEHSRHSLRIEGDNAYPTQVAILGDLQKKMSILDHINKNNLNETQQVLKIISTFKINRTINVVFPEINQTLHNMIPVQNSDDKKTDVQRPLMSNFKYRYPYHSNWSKEPLFERWSSVPRYRDACQSRFIGYNGIFVHLKGVYLKRSLFYAKAIGGEDPHSVINRKDEDEMYTFKKGAFTLPCTNAPSQYKVQSNVAHLSAWLENLAFVSELEEKALDNQTDSEIHELTIALTRYEYANVYWTVMDIYDAFLMMKFFNFTPEKTHILWIDARPKSQLDELWTPLFGRVERLSSHAPLTKFHNLVWCVTRAYSPMLKRIQTLPLLQPFKQFVFSKYGIKPQEKINCDQPKVLFVWRRDYMAHPRNPNGLVSRKISNEQELINQTTTAFPTFQITGMQLDLLSIHNQLDLISHTDILIGMHGAAFAFGLFLPSGAGEVEFYPKSSSQNWHMQYIAQWNNVEYFSSKNNQSKNEDTKKKTTYVPPSVVVEQLTKVYKKICKRNVKVKVG